MPALETVFPATSLLALGRDTVLGDIETFLLPARCPLYHGTRSVALTEADVPYPVGPVRYDPRTSRDEPAVSYYSSVDVARYYAGREGVLLAFETSRPLALVRGSAANFERFWPECPDAVRQSLATLYGFRPGVRTLSRRKGSVTDVSWVEWLRRRFDRTFDGVFVDRLWRDPERTTDLSLRGASQDEVILFDATECLRRRLEDPLDWQHSPFLHLSSAIHELRVQMGRYETTNARFHAGNLWEHSVWSCLWAERLPALLGIPEPPFLASVSALALLHDIGKCRPEECLRRGDRWVYFSQPRHPEAGADLLSGRAPFPRIDDDGNVAPDGAFVGRLLRDLGLDGEEAAWIAERHWDLGPVLARWKRSGCCPRLARDFVAETLEKKKKKEGRGKSGGFDDVLKLLLVSLADVLAAQPPHPSTPMVNLASRFWPVVNVPRVYKGVSAVSERLGLTGSDEMRLFFHQALGDLAVLDGSDDGESGGRGEMEWHDDVGAPRR